GHRLHDPRVGVAGRDHRDPAQEVEVLAAAGVPQVDPLATHELDLGPDVGRPQHRRLPLGQVGHVPTSSSSPATMVPTPESVNSSSSRACSRRPSRMWARPTPPRRAVTIPVSLGTIPAATWPAARVASTPAPPRWGGSA